MLDVRRGVYWRGAIVPVIAIALAGVAGTVVWMISPWDQARSCKADVSAELKRCLAQEGTTSSLAACYSQSVAGDARCELTPTEKAARAAGVHEAQDAEIKAQMLEAIRTDALGIDLQEKRIRTDDMSPDAVRLRNGIADRRKDLRELCELQGLENCLEVFPVRDSPK